MLSKFAKVLIATVALLPAGVASAAPPDPEHPWRYDHWPQQQPWQQDRPLSALQLTARGTAGDRPAELDEPGQHDVGRLLQAAGHELGRPRRQGVQAHLQRRAGAARLSQPAVRGHPAEGLDRLREPERRGQRRPARPGRAVLRGLPQHAQRAQPRPHHPRVLDGGLRRPLRRRADRVRPVHDAGQGPRVRHGVPGGHRLPGRRHLQPEHPDRRPCRVGRGRRQRCPERLRLRLLPQRRAGRVVDLAGVRPDQVPHQGSGDRRLRPAGRGPAQLGQHPLRRVDLLGVGLEPLAQRRRRVVDPGRELRTGRRTPTSSATSSASATTTTTRSACRRAVPTPGSGRCSAAAPSTGPAVRTAAG